jgi:hypothetical protein
MLYQEWKYVQFLYIYVEKLEDFILNDLTDFTSTFQPNTLPMFVRSYLAIFAASNQNSVPLK